MKYSKLIMLSLVFILSCSSAQKTNSVKTGNDKHINEVDFSRKSDWEIYSYGLFYKNLAIQNKMNVKGDSYLQIAIKAFLEAENSGRSLDLVYMHLAECHFIDYNYAKALDYTDKAIVVNNTRIEPYKLKYKIQMRLKNYDKAAQALKDYLAVNPDDITVQFVLAEHYYEKLRDYNDALTAFNRVIELSEQQAIEGYYLETSLYYSGFIYYKNGDIKNAIGQYEKVYQLNQDNLNSVYFLAHLYMINYNLKNANTYAMKYYKKNPENFEINVLIGRIKLLTNKMNTASFFRKGKNSRSINGLLAAGLYNEAKKNNEKAEKILTTIIRMRPNKFITPYLALARIHERKGDKNQAFLNYLAAGMLMYKKGLYQQAQYYLHIANKYNKEEPGLFYYLGRTYEDNNNISLAIIYYKKTLELKSSTDLITHIGYLYGTKNQYDKAFSYLEKAMIEEPENSKPYFFKGIISLWQEKYEVAEQNVKKAINLQEKNDTYHYYHAIILEKRKKFDEAIISLNKAIKYNPQSARALNFLGYLYADMDIKIDESLVLIEKALKIEPDNGAYIDSLGWVYYRQGKYKLALKNLLRAEKILKGRNIVDPVVYDHIGDTYIKMGKTGLAIEYWKKSVKIKKNERIDLKIRKHSGQK